MGLIRLLLALSVVMAHLGSIGGYQIAGVLAVQSFFIISGFYMTLILREKYIQKNSYWLFISNRFLRIYPTYWLILLLTVLLYFIFFLGGNRNNPIWDFFSLMSRGNYFSLLQHTLTTIQRNIFIFTLGHYYTIKANNLNAFIIPQTWTLGLELLFYAIAPFILRRSIYFIICLMILSFLIRIFVHNVNSAEGSIFTYYFFPGVLCYFLLGSLSYFIYKWVDSVEKLKKYLILPLLVTVLFMAVFSLFPYDQKILHISLKYYFYTVFVLSIGPIFSYTKKIKWDNLLGELSYPMYISHIFIILSLRATFLNKLDKNIFSITSICIVILFSFGILKVFESPIEKYRQMRIRNKEALKSSKHLK